MKAPALRKLLPNASTDPSSDYNLTSDYDREKYEERLAKLIGGVAIIKVGGLTDMIMKEQKAW